MDTPSAPQAASPSPLTAVLAEVLTKLVQRNDVLPFDPSHATLFHSRRAPSFSIEQYLDRILRHAACSQECVILSLIYIDRLIEFNRSFMLTSRNIHRLLITSLVVAAKFIDDLYYTNKFYAALGGISVAEMNNLELEFLFMLNFSLHVSQEKYQRYYSELCKHAPCPLVQTEAAATSPPLSPLAGSERVSPPLVSPPPPPAPPPNRPIARPSLSSYALGVRPLPISSGPIRPSSSSAAVPLASATKLRQAWPPPPAYLPAPAPPVSKTAPTSYPMAALLRRPSESGSLAHAVPIVISS